MSKSFESGWLIINVHFFIERKENCVQTFMSYYYLLNEKQYFYILNVIKFIT